VTKRILAADFSASVDYEPLNMLLAEARQMKPSLAFSARTSAAARAWRKVAADAFTKALGRTPKRVLSKPRLLARVKRRGYTIEAYEVATAPRMKCPFFLLIPDSISKGAPAILCSHGHGDGVNPLLGYDRKGKPLKREEYQKQFAVQSVKAGFVTLAHEQIAFGRRVDFGWRATHKIPKDYSPCVQPSLAALQIGYTMGGLRVFEAQRMLDILSSRPEVDRRRIGMVGISGGGLVTLYTSAIDTRIKAACVSGFVNTFFDSIISLHHCPDSYTPGLLTLLDNPDIACLVAPRALLVEAGTRDDIFPVAAVRKAMKTIRRAYAAYGVPEKLDVDYFDGEHQFSGRKTWDFFREQL
jgi:hypothetical protein